MSYDILLGYTGIVSFGHAMFFWNRRLYDGCHVETDGCNTNNVLVVHRDRDVFCRDDKFPRRFTDTTFKKSLFLPC